MTEITFNEYPPDDVQMPIPAVVFRYLDWAAWIAKIIKSLGSAHRRHAARRRAQAVDARVLSDIGVSEAQRFIEVNKSFWER